MFWQKSAAPCLTWRPVEGHVDMLNLTETSRRVDYGMKTVGSGFDFQQRKDIFLWYKMPRLILRPTGTPVASLQLTEQEGDLYTSTGCEVRIVWRYTSVLRGVLFNYHRDDFPLAQTLFRQFSRHNSNKVLSIAGINFYYCYCLYFTDLLWQRLYQTAWLCLSKFISMLYSR
jgi:hypothetical protein